MIDYKTTVGENVIRYDGVKGVITKVDNRGIIYIKCQDDIHEGGFLYDPFLNETFKFENLSLQNQIDIELDKINRDNINLVNKTKADSKTNEKFYITMRNNETNLEERVHSLNCTIDEAYRVFSYVVREQQKVFRSSNIKWRQVRMYDASTNKIIAQES